MVQQVGYLPNPGLFPSIPYDLLSTTKSDYRVHCTEEEEKKPKASKQTKTIKKALRFFSKQELVNIIYMVIY